MGAGRNSIGDETQRMKACRDIMVQMIPNVAKKDAIPSLEFSMSFGLFNSGSSSSRPDEP